MSIALVSGTNTWYGSYGVSTGGSTAVAAQPAGTTFVVFIAHCATSAVGINSVTATNVAFYAGAHSAERDPGSGIYYICDICIGQVAATSGASINVAFASQIQGALCVIMAFNGLHSGNPIETNFIETDTATDTAAAVTNVTTSNPGDMELYVAAVRSAMGTTFTPPFANGPGVRTQNSPQLLGLCADYRVNGAPVGAHTVQLQYAPAGSNVGAVTVVLSGAASGNPSGVQGSSSQGQLAISSTANVAVTGIQSASGKTAPVASFSVTASPNGVQAASGISDPTVAISTRGAPTGVQSTSGISAPSVSIATSVGVPGLKTNSAATAPTASGSTSGNGKIYVVTGAANSANQGAAAAVLLGRATGGLPNGARCFGAAIRVANARGESDGYNIATANQFVSGVAFAASRSTLVAKPSRRRIAYVAAFGKALAGGKARAIRHVSGVITGLGSAGSNPFIYETGVLAGANFLGASTGATLFAHAAAENVATAWCSATRVAMANTAIISSTTLLADPNTHAECLGIGQSATTGSPKRLACVSGTISGRSLAYGACVAPNVRNLIVGHSDLLAHAIQIFAICGYVQAKSRSQASGSHGRITSAGSSRGGSIATAAFRKLQKAAGTVAGRSSAAANPYAVTATAAIEDNSSALTGTAIWLLNAACEIDGSSDIESNTACIFMGEGFEQHFNSLSGSPTALQDIAAASHSYNAAYAAPVAKSVPMSGVAAGHSSALYSRAPIIAEPIYLAGVTDVTGYLSGPLHAVGNVWCTSFASAKGRRSKPIAGRLAGTSRALGAAA